jgi:heat shock protein HslJ
VSGISYITVYRQDASPLVGSELLYTFQGLSADGAQYVAAIFRLNTELLPAEIPADFDYEAFIEEIDPYMADTVATLNAGTADDFTPSLTTLDALIQTFSFTSTATPEPVATETPDSGDLAGSGLAGVTWTLVSYGDPSSPQSVLSNAPITLTFAETGVAGSAGCNQYNGSFQFDNDTLTVGELVTTRMACEDAVMTQETAYIAALQSAASFAVTDGQLQIFYDGGVLMFTSGSGGGADLGGLAGTWNLVSYGDPNSPQPVIGGTPVTLTIASDGASGNGGCNQYGTGTVVVENDTVRFGQIISTLMACADANVTAQETAYLGALQSATSFAVTDGQLQIFYDGGVLNFTAA